MWRWSSPVLRTCLVGLSLGTIGFSIACCAGPGPGLTGNDTGGIIPYSPAVDKIYPQMARDHCARWGRLAHVTSVNRRYGDYIAFVCVDRPWVVH